MIQSLSKVVHVSTLIEAAFWTMRTRRIYSPIFVPISTFPTGLPHSQMNRFSRFQVWRDLPTWVWGAAMENMLSWFPMGAQPGISGLFKVGAFCGVSSRVGFGWLEGLVFWQNRHQVQVLILKILFLYLTYEFIFHQSFASVLITRQDFHPKVAC